MAEPVSLSAAWRRAKALSAGACRSLRARVRALPLAPASVPVPVPVPAPAPPGQLRLLSRGDGRPRCTACGDCVAACPAQCLHLVVAHEAETEADGDAAPAAAAAHAVAPAAPRPYPAAFAVDQLQCISCALCVSACPEDALRMDTGTQAPAAFSRVDAVVGRTELTALCGRPGARPAFGRQNVVEKRSRGR